MFLWFLVLSMNILVLQFIHFACTATLDSDDFPSMFQVSVQYRVIMYCVVYQAFIIVKLGYRVFISLFILIFPTLLRLYLTAHYHRLYMRFYNFMIDEVNSWK